MPTGDEKNTEKEIPIDGAEGDLPGSTSDAGSVEATTTTTTTTTTTAAGGGGGASGSGGGGTGSFGSARDAGDGPPDLPRHLTEPIRIESMPPLPGSPAAGPASVQLQRSGMVDTDSLALWAAIAQHTDAVSFSAFESWVNRVLCQSPGTVEDSFDTVVVRLREQLHDSYINSYDLLMRAAEVFLLTQAGVWQLSGPPGGVEPRLHFGARGRVLPPDATASRDVLRLERQNIRYDVLNDRLEQYLGHDGNNYLRTVLRANFNEGDVSVSPFCASYLDPSGPYLLELIWSYWIEQAMLVQGFNAILLRFQNVRRGETEPLANLDLTPLRPLSNFLWGWLRDEYRHLSVARRAYEYTHQYGLALSGKAVGELHPADPRTTFLAAFHNLLRLCSAFYKEDADTTYIADAFPLLNALKDLSLILSQGAGNQFRDLPWQARQEMLVQQWLMSRPELKNFLGGRAMVAYPETWMSRVDAVRRMERWGEVSVLHFNDLARFGERILLSVRYGSWMGQSDQEVARTWARFWKPEVQGYLYAYKAVTGVDLASDQPDPRTGDLRYVQPALLLERQLQPGLILPAPKVGEVVA
ncbi:MAG TPA: hypothetical protein VGC13_09670 [Longimicrobium sp.]|jgi:hypothetical protein|uniref:hypothetical protein n=1 Tax=Longimicrobium sp. TaxID=2029185 RepID=UPI002EDA125C